MDPSVKWFALGAGVFVILILWIIVKAAMSGRRRAAAIKDWAFRNGMSYVEGPVDPESVAKIREPPCRSKKAQTRTVTSADQLETLINDATGIAQQFHQGF